MDKYTSIAMCANISRLHLNGTIINRAKLIKYSTIKNNSVLAKLIKFHAILKLGQNKYKFNNKPIHHFLIESVLKVINYVTCNIFNGFNFLIMFYGR